MLSVFLSPSKLRFHKDTRILDIGCGRGKIAGAFKRNFKLFNKPIGIDIINHSDKDKNIEFKKIDIFSNWKKIRILLIYSYQANYSFF